MSASRFLTMPELTCALHIDIPVHFPLHCHAASGELLWITEGRAEYRIDDKTYTAEANSIVLFQQGIWHEERSDASRPFSYYCLGFEELRLQGLPDNFLLERNRSPVIDCSKYAVEIGRMVRAIHKEKNSSAPESQFIADQQFGLLLGYLCRWFHYPAETGTRRIPSNTRAVAMAQTFISLHYDKPLTLDMIAKAAMTSPFYLSRLFKQETGVSPMKYVIQYRMEVAKRYLSTTEDSIESISEKVGYASPTYFHNIFKQTEGQSPGAFRKSLL